VTYAGNKTLLIKIDPDRLTRLMASGATH